MHEFQQPVDLDAFDDVIPIPQVTAPPEPQVAPDVDPEQEDDFLAQATIAPPTEKPLATANGDDGDGEDLQEGPGPDPVATKKALAKKRARTARGSHDGVEAEGQEAPATSKYPCPTGFRLTAGGLEFLHTTGSGENCREEWVSVCRPIRVLAQLAEGRARYYVIRYRDDKGRKQEHVLPGREVTNAKELEAIFAELGIGRGPGAKYLAEFFRRLTFSSLLPVGTLTKKMGWNDSRYMLPTGPIAPAGFEGEPIFFSSGSDLTSLKAKGSMKAWQQEVAFPIRQSSRLMFSLCAALAATMMTPLRVQTGGFNLVGETSEGKSTCMETAVSAWGAPAFILSWEATPVGMEQYAVVRNDTPMILDEQGLANIKDLGKIIYHLCSGAEKLRGSKEVCARPIKTWTTMLLSTSEKSVADKMEEAGEQVQAGQEVRLVHIPIRPPGKTQAIEKWEGFESSEAMVKHLHVAVDENYGHAAPAFIKVLVNYQQEQWDRLKEGLATWVKRNTPEDAVHQVRRVADRFALVAVAGEIGIEEGILPWQRGDASWAAVECFQSWLQYRGGAGSSEAGVASRGLLAFLTKHDARFEPRAHSDQGEQKRLVVRDRAGWYDCLDGETFARTYYITPAALKEAVKGIPFDRVVSALIGDGLIEKTARKNDRHVGQSQLHVPGHGRQWVYRVTATAREAFEARERGLPAPQPIQAEISLDQIEI